MVKREFAANPDIDVDAPRPKRHKDSVVETPAADEGEGDDQRASSDRENENGEQTAEAAPALSPEEVREEGLKVLQMLKEMVDKEGRSISYDFIRLPSKRQFPDYYDIIQQPIALDDIKTQLDNHAYPSLEALRQDFETCFKNAKKYNQRESRIWKDAKSLQKRANKEIDKILRRGDENEEGSDREGKKKEKGVNIHRLMKNRLLKLVGKADDSGRQLSPVFMDLPSKKKWPVYYKLIKKPVCIEDIFKRIKRKEYHTIPDFMNDVDLVFANAMQFNEEHSLIWEDALILKLYFQQIMNDLPAKYNMNGPEGDSTSSPPNKIRIKLPGHQATVHADGASGPEGNNVVRLRVPGLGTSDGTGDDKQGSAGQATVKTDSPALPSEGLPSSASISYSTHASNMATAPTQASAPTPALAMPTPKLAKAAAAAPSHMKSALAQVTSQQQQQTPYTRYSQYSATNHIPSQNFYSPAAPRTSQTPTRGSATPAPSAPPPAVLTGRTDAPSPVPPVSAAGLYSMRLESYVPGSSQSRRRLAVLDTRAGVRNFAIHVPATEAKLVIHGVKFSLHDGDGEGGDGSEMDDEAKVAQIPVKRRGRGRPKKNVPSTEPEMQPPIVPPESSPPPTLPFLDVNKDKRDWRVPSSSEVMVRLDGKEVSASTKGSTNSPPVVVNGNGELTNGDVNSESGSKPEDMWTVEVSRGQHVLEVGRKGNSVQWRIYLSVS